MDTAVHTSGQAVRKAADTASANPLPGWQRVVLYGTGGLLLATGVLWLAVHYGVGAGAGGLPHPLEAWLLRLHGAATFAALFALGGVAAVHVPAGWRLGRRARGAGQRASGLALCLLAAVLAISAYLLYYFAPEPLRPALGWAHSAAGLAMAALLVLHRRRRGLSPACTGADQGSEDLAAARSE